MNASEDALSACYQLGKMIVCALGLVLLTGIFRPTRAMLYVWLAVAIGIPVLWGAYSGWRTFTRLAPRAPTACRSCGYDLTGNTSGRCPECGRPAPHL